MAEGYVQPIPNDRPSIDILFRIFSHPRRRFVLRHLVGRPLPTDTARLARAITVSEGTRSDDDLFDLERVAVESSLVHVHLPTLEEAGLIHWYRETETVSLTPVAAGMPIVSQLGDNRLQTTFFGTEE